MPVKPGYRTTEFWVAGLPGLVFSVISSLKGVGIPFPVWVGPLMTVFYVLSRGVAKINSKGD